MFVLCLFIATATTVPSMVWIIWSQVSWLLLVLLYVWTASQACRFFVEARRSGLMELLSVTPLSSREIVAGQWRAWLRMFGLPVGLFLLVQVAGGCFSQHTTIRTTIFPAGAYAPSFIYGLLVAALGAVSTAANLIALIWFGMWMGLTSKNGSIAALRTVLFVQVLPWLGISFASTSIVGLLMFRRAVSAGAPSNTLLMSFPLAMAGLAGVLSISKDAAFFLWARQRLYSSVREVATWSIQARDSVGTVKPQTRDIPPVIATQP